MDVQLYRKSQEFRCPSASSDKYNLYLRVYLIDKADSMETVGIGFYYLMLPTHESKTTGHKFNGRKGVGDEVLELPISIMQDNTQVVGWQREV